MDFADTEEDNFLDRFRVGPNIDHDFVDEVADLHCSGASSSSTGPLLRPGEMALPASWQKPRCEECKLEDEEGGGRYGTDDHNGLFYCGRCWKAWDEAERQKIMKPLWQQKALKKTEDVRQGDCENFFATYSGGPGSDDIDGAWDPGQKPVLRAGEMALPGSFDRPKCAQCGNDEGEVGGGRYGHGDKADKFFCGRCWQSWDEDDRRRMMMAYAPSSRWSNDCVGCAPMDPVVYCPPPEPPPLNDDDCFGFDGFGPDSEDDFEPGPP